MKFYKIKIYIETMTNFEIFKIKNYYFIFYKLKVYLKNGIGCKINYFQEKGELPTDRRTK